MNVRPEIVFFSLGASDASAARLSTWSQPLTLRRMRMCRFVLAALMYEPVAQGFLDDGIFRADQHAVGHLLLRAHLLVGDGASRRGAVVCVALRRPRPVSRVAGRGAARRRLLGMATGLGVS